MSPETRPDLPAPEMPTHEMDPAPPAPATADPDAPKHWLVRPQTIRLLWIICAVILALTVLAQLLFPVKGYFEIDGWFGFNAVYGLVSCAIMVVVAKLLGFILKRRDDHYDL